MRKRDIKLEKYYYCINKFENFSYSLINNPIVKFKYTEDLIISSSKDIYLTFEEAKQSILKNLEKFIKNKKRLINKPKLYRKRQSFGTLFDSFTNVIKEIG